MSVLTAPAVPPGVDVAAPMPRSGQWAGRRSGQWARKFGTIRAMCASELTDLEVALDFQSGREEALTEAYHRWSRLVHATALRSTGNPDDAADITQMVFVNAWRGSDGYRPGGRLAAGLADDDHPPTDRGPLGVPDP